jgi:peptide/nickel transport system ATP-binding protein
LLEHATATDILSVKNLNVYCPSGLDGNRLSLVDGVTLAVNQGEILGLVGETGAGKSTLLDAIGCNPRPPLWVEVDTLTIRLEEHIVDLSEQDEAGLRQVWRKAIAFIPSNAKDRLNPIMTVGEQVKNILEAKLQISSESARQKTLEMFEMVQMPDPKRNYDNYPHELSGGMAQRVLISVALASSPRLLLADEPTKGLDVTIQTQVLDLMAKLLRDLSSGVLLATRDLGIVANYCHRVAAMCHGQMVEIADMRSFFKHPVHPYSRYLLAAAFASQGREEDFESVAAEKSGVDMKTLPGCRFSDRCPSAKDICRATTPEETILESTHSVRCHGWEGKWLDTSTDD